MSIGLGFGLQFGVWGLGFGVHNPKLAQQRKSENNAFLRDISDVQFGVMNPKTEPQTPN